MPTKCREVSSVQGIVSMNKIVDITFGLFLFGILGINIDKMAFSKGILRIVIINNF